MTLLAKDGSLGASTAASSLCGFFLLKKLNIPWTPAAELLGGDSDSDTPFSASGDAIAAVFSNVVYPLLPAASPGFEPCLISGSKPAGAKLEVPSLLSSSTSAKLVISLLVRIPKGGSYL